MGKKTIEIELFLTSEENVIKQNKNVLVDDVHGYNYSLLKNIDDWIDHCREYNHIKTDRSIRFGRTVINKHLFKSKHVDGLRSEIVVRLTISVPDEAAEARLASLGYSKEKAGEYYKEIDSLYCILCNESIFYDDFSLLCHVEEIAEKEYLEVREKESSAANGS